MRKLILGAALLSLGLGVALRASANARWEVDKLVWNNCGGHDAVTITYELNMYGQVVEVGRVVHWSNCTEPNG